MPAQLVSLTDGPSILLDKPILLIGRHPECDIQIDSRKVSRRHCCMAQVGESLIVRDLGSTNGIRVNGVRMLEGRLRPGDELTIGNARFQLRWDTVAGAPAPVVRPPRHVPTPVNPPPRAVADAMLDSWDEPMPLPEPPAAGLKAVRQAQPASPPAPAPAIEKPPSPPPPEEDALIVPEHLQLAPVSDEFPSPLNPANPPESVADASGS